MPVSPSVVKRRSISAFFDIIDAKLAKPWKPEEMSGGRYVEFNVNDLSLLEADEIAVEYRKVDWLVRVARPSPGDPSMLAIVFTLPSGAS